MTNKEVIFQELNKISPQAICDDCLSELLNIKPRQQTNQICNKLASQEKILRKKGECMMHCARVHSKLVNSFKKVVATKTI